MTRRQPRPAPPTPRGRFKVWYRAARARNLRGASGATWACALALGAGLAAGFDAPAPTRAQVLAEAGELRRQVRWIRQGASRQDAQALTADLVDQVRDLLALADALPPSRICAI